MSLTVTNTGAKYTATDSVLLFLFDVYRRVTPEYKLLKRYDVMSFLFFALVAFLISFNLFTSYLLQI